MSYSHANEPLVHNLGGGDDKPLRLVTDGQVRILVRGDGTIEFPGGFGSSTGPITGTGPGPGRGARLFFRLDEAGKWQFCVQFPSGVAQVLATEP